LVIFIISKILFNSLRPAGRGRRGACGTKPLR